MSWLKGKYRLKGDVIKARMAELNFTIWQLVSYSGVSKPALDRALNGECVIGRTLYGLSQTLNVPIKDLVAEEVKS